MIDFDFQWPTEESISSDGDMSHFIALKVEAYQASPEYKQLVSDHVIRLSMEALQRLSLQDKESAAWGAYAWMQTAEAGMPMVSLLEGGVRSEARFWSETATPAELECYALAACDKLSGHTGHALFASRQIKRLAGALFRRMSPKEKSAFAKWIDEQGKEE